MAMASPRRIVVPAAYQQALPATCPSGTSVGSPFTVMIMRTARGENGQPSSGSSPRRQQLDDEIGGHRGQQDPVAVVPGGDDERDRPSGRSPAHCQPSPDAGPTTASVNASSVTPGTSSYAARSSS